jgi:hypothetical protein
VGLLRCTLASGGRAAAARGIATCEGFAGDAASARARLLRCSTLLPLSTDPEGPPVCHFFLKAAMIAPIPASKPPTAVRIPGNVDQNDGGLPIVEGLVFAPDDAVEAGLLLAPDDVASGVRPAGGGPTTTPDPPWRVPSEGGGGTTMRAYRTMPSRQGSFLPANS